MDWLATQLVRWIKAVAIILGGTVASVELWNTPLELITRVFDNSTLMKIGLMIFFFGWWWGATNDTEIQREGYCRGSKKGEAWLWKKPLEFSYSWLSSRCCSSCTTDLVLFQAALLLFILVNTWTWRVIFRRTSPHDRSVLSKIHGQRRTLGIDSVRWRSCWSSSNISNGPWQRRRFLTLVLLAALQLLVAVLIQSGSVVGYFAGLSVRGVPAPILIGYLPGVLFILYVLISEIWMKIYRIKTLLRSAKQSNIWRSSFDQQAPRRPAPEAPSRRLR